MVALFLRLWCFFFHGKPYLTLTPNLYRCEKCLRTWNREDLFY